MPRSPGSSPPAGRAALLALCATLVALAPAPARGQGGDRVPVPRPGELNEPMLEIARSYPTDGTHPYHWPREGDWAGTTRDLVYDGVTIAEGDAEGRCYCSGITFEVFFRAWRTWCEARDLPFRIGELDADGVRRLRVMWYGADGDRRTVLHALEETGLGRAVSPRDARPGDLVQLWRRSGSGHTAIFLGWERDGDRVTGLRYWSSQGSTDGIGVNAEPIGPDGVDPEELHIARVGRPPASRD